MRLIAILLALWANRYPHQADRWRRPEPVQRYVDWLSARLSRRADGDGALRLAVVLAPPILLFGLLQVWLDGWLFGIGEIVLGGWALVFAHGPGRVDDQLERFLDAWREGRLHTARTVAADLAGGDLASVSDWQLPATALQGLFWQSYRRLLAGIFWLLILGPVGPVALHLVVLTRDAARRADDESLASSSAALLHALDWLPARAAALSFGLAGSFVHAVDRWRASQEEPDAGARELVVEAGVGALYLDRPPADPDAAEDVLREARDLVGRCVMIWIAVAALLTIAGWLY